jgi:HEAT repeat protein
MTLLLATLGAAGVPSTAGGQVVAATNPTGEQENVRRDIAQLVTRLGDEAIRQDDRDEAARRLVARGSDEARAALRQALEGGSRTAQLAAVRALAGEPRPDPNLIPVLFRMIGPDRLMSEAAIRALTTYQGIPDVTTRLVNLATDRNEREPTRVAAILGLGSFVDKHAAGTLVDILGRDGESAGITAAAAQALADLTGLRENGRDAEKWRRWWAENLGRPEGEFREIVRSSQAARYVRLRARHRDLQDEVAALLSDQYQLAPDGQKPELLLRYLRSADPVIRVTGARLFFDDAVNNRTLPAAALTQLRTMVGDSSADVRLAVADALRAVNDSQATMQLLAQLAQESDEDVHAAIGRALGVSGDVRALPALRGMLKEPSLAVARAAAEAIRELGPVVREADPALARATAGELRAVLERPGTEPGSQALRESVVMAMGPLRDPSLVPVYYRLLRSADSAQLRRAALKALGELREPQAADAIVNLLEDPDAIVRLEAVDALGKVGTFQNAGSLYRRMRPDVEEDASVRDRAWQVMQGLMPTAPPEQLAQWAERFAEDPERRLVVLTAMAERGERDGLAEPLAYTRKAIGDTLMSLNRPGDAVRYLKQSLDYWAPKEPKGMMAVSVGQQLLNALLRARQYPAAVAFGGELLAADLSNQQTVGPAFRAETRRLIDANDLSGAQAVITESRRMSPPLDPRYAQALADMESEIRRRVAEGQERRTNGPRSAGVEFAGWKLGV